MLKLLIHKNVIVIYAIELKNFFYLIFQVQGASSLSHLTNRKRQTKKPWSWKI